MYAKSKKVASFLFTLFLFVSIMTICASASNVPSNSKWANISSKQSYACSGRVIGTYKFFGGSNYSNSKHNLTICSRYFDASSNSWMFDKKIKVAPNSTLNDTRTATFAQEISWQVYLKPYGWCTSGCDGEGYIWYDM